MVLSDTIQHEEDSKVLNGASLSWKSTFDNVKEIAELLPQVIYEMDLSGKLLFVNKQALELFQYSREDFEAGLSTFDMLASQEVPRVKENIARILKGEKLAGNEYIFKRKNGTTFPGLLYSTPIIHDDKPVGFRGAIVDITERKKAEEALRREKEFTDNLIRTAQTIILVLDPKGCIISINPYMEKISGYLFEEVRGKDWFETFLPKEDHKRIREIFQRSIGDIQTRGNINLIVAKDGHLIEIEWYDKTIKAADGSIMGLLAIGQDATERKKTEKLLWDSEEKYHTIADFTFDWETWLGVDGKYLYVSPACKRISGYDPEDFVSDPQLLEKITHPDDRKKLHDHICKHIKDSNLKDVHIDFRIITSTGEERWISHYCQPIYSKEGVFLGKRASNRDVTERIKMELALKTSEKKYRQLIETLNEGIWVIDQNSITTFVNPRMAEILGYTAEEMMGKHLFSFMDEQGTTIAAQDVERRKQGIKEQHDFEFIKKDGTRIITILETAPIIDDSGNYQGAIAGVLDITERKKLERELQEGEERYKKITEGLSDYLYTVRVQDGRAINTIHGQACETVTGYSTEEFKADPYLWIHMVPAEERDLVRECARKILAGEKINPMEHRIIRKDGQVCWVIDTPILHFNKQGRLVSYDGVIKNITERKASEEKLRETQERYQSLYDLSLEMVYLCDFQGRFIDANPAALKLLGYTKEEITSFTLVSLLDQEQQPQAVQILETLKTTGYQPEPREYKIRCKNGQYVNVETISTLVYQNGTPVAVQGTARDITQQKLADGQLKEAHRIVTSMNTELERQVKQRTEQIENLLNQKDEFIQMLGHDLKNPLTPLVTLLPIIQKKEQDVKQKELLQVVQRNVHIIKELVEKTVKLAILSEPTVHFETQPIPLGSEVEKSINILEAMFTDHHIITENLISDTVVVDVEPMRLREILDNLFTNSVKFSPAGGKITVDAQPDNDMVVISVKDTGIGITLEQMPHIFEEFYKADFSRHDLDSSGLGLPICKRIVEKHGGKIWAESHGTDKGSTIFFTLRSVKKPK